MQWKLFEGDLLGKLGYTNETLPVNYYGANNDLIDVWSVAYKDMFYIGCKGAPKHTDEGFPPYSALLVLKNDGLIAKPCYIPKHKLEPQTVGTVLILNISKYHHCIKDPKLPQHPDNTWVALGKDFKTKPTKEEVNLLFEEFFNEDN